MRIAPVCSFVLLSLAALPASAQLGGAQGQAGGIKPPPAESKAAVPPPDAVPGAKARPDSVTPLKGGTSDLPPTEALFDSINRGDIVTARDAINRGADLDSTNLLGLTPIELSVDLGRNDISFLLLSMRGAIGASSVPTRPVPAATVTADRRARRPAVAAAMREGTAAPVQAPRLFAGDGGAPLPSAGFLGFDPHR